MNKRHGRSSVDSDITGGETSVKFNHLLHVLPKRIEPEQDECTNIAVALSVAVFFIVLFMILLGYYTDTPIPRNPRCYIE